ncbi:MAG: type II/IV secretion system protein [Rubrivivax sp.]|nr:MAG: type II/IV secretion system protein [Rubrivivax sp.]
MGIAVFTVGSGEPVGQPVNGCVLMSLRDHPQALVVAVADPWDQQLVDQLIQTLGQLPELAAVAGKDLSAWLAAVRDKSKASSCDSAASFPVPGNEHADDEVIRFVGAALEVAVGQGSSDVHFETDRQGLSVKHRLDGVLRAGSRIESVQRAEEVISRIKVLAKLDITERRIPQDGRFRHVLPSGQGMDLRVSIMPSVHGEDAVLRLLDRAQLRNASASASLDALQFDEVSVTRIRELAQLPHGMLLITGPTGSGKTTTVYGILSELNSGEEKIVTIEDPVEYELPGVLQIPVNERKGLTFAKGLRSILRHDPDRILVGEIRDAETAEIAVQSALTGHQVFTTVHANSLFDVTGRFRHFGLDMFGFVAALNGVVVQRLVRGLCSHCGSVRPATEREQQWMARHGFTDVVHVPAPIGCAQCSGTGYRRRFVLAEVHEIDDGVRDLITSQQALSALRAHVVASGVASLGRMSAIAVKDGRTSLEEIRRVVGLA